MATREFFVGLMSGTSLDGVDGALVEFGNAGTRLIATAYLPFDEKLRRDLLELQVAGHDELHHAARLGNALSHQYAAAVFALTRQANIPAATIAAIGCHGQTIRHRPDEAYTIQIGNAALLAELTGIRVIADFRSRDLAAGGQGAPLVPAFHLAQFGSATERRVIVNIGGIANLTHLPPEGPVVGFDTGPGNLLLDLWIQRHQGKPCDEDGAWGRSGKVRADLLGSMLADPYFSEPPPKSTGRDTFNAAWLETHAPGRYAAEDVQATLAGLTAQSIAAAVRQHCAGATHVYACGGGARNLDLMDRLRQNLPACRVGSTADLGTDPDWVEAVAFAWLARRCLLGESGNLPEVTGARGLRVLGAIYPA